MKRKIVIAIVLLALSLSFSGCRITGEAKGGNAPSKPACSDSVDNDGDNFCDYLGCWLGKGKNKIWMASDPGCESEQDTDEYNAPAPVCGDGSCNGVETCSSCSLDCGTCPPVCGDGECNGAETCSTCVQDCGACPPVCNDGICEGNEICETCPEDCGACPPVCGDSVCEGDENCSACPTDCGACPIDNYEESPFGIWSSTDGYNIDAPDILSMKGIGIHWEAAPVPPLLPVRWQEWESSYNYYKNTGVKPVPSINLLRGRDNSGGLNMPPKDYYESVKDAVAYFSDIDYWMLGVEIDNQYTRGTITPEEYALYTRLTYKALKEVRTTSKLASSGTGGATRSYQNDGFFVLVFNELKKMENIEKNPSLYDWSANPYKLTQSDFDVVFSPDNYEEYMDIHHISNFDFALSRYRTYTEPLIKTIQDFLASQGYGNVALWTTQTALHNGQPTNYSYQSEKQQANGLIRKYVLSTYLGVDKIFWVSTYEMGVWKGNPEDYFTKVGLIYNGVGKDDLGAGVKKLSYYAYKKMVEKLEGSDWDNIELVLESNGVYVYKFLKDGKPIWIAWNDVAERQVTINVGSISSVKITEAIPKYETGQEVSDYNTAFNTEIKTVSNGQVSLFLGVTPVFMEEI